MKEKIQAALKTMYANLGLSDAVLGTVAELLAGTVTSDDQIAAKVEAAKPILTGLQSDVDARVRVATEKLKKDQNTEQPTPAPTPTPQPNPANPNPDAITLLSQGFLRLEKLVTGLVQEKTTGSRKSQYEAKLAKVPDAIKAMLLGNFDLLQFQDDAAFESWLGNQDTAIAGLVQNDANGKLGNMGKPAAANGGNDADKTSVLNDVLAYSKATNPAAAPAAVPAK